MPSLWKGLAQWIDERTGAHQFLHKVLDEPIPGGSRFAYVFGSALLFILVLQFVTGVSLALYYVPSPVTAHVSVSYIVKQVAAGSFLRSLHSYGSSAMVVVLLLHFLQTFLYGSYKGKRELLWIAGCVLSLLVLGMAFTGYLLPWDQKAYFATSVGTNVAGQAPVVGEWVRQLLRGGTSMGTLTISRFYVLHVFVLPISIVLFLASHVLLFRKAGAAGPIRERKHPSRSRIEMFYPNQVLKDMAFALVVMGILGMLAHLIPVKLGPIANPADSHYLPRPEWYYLPLFQWLKYWEGPQAVLGMVIIPTILVVLLFLLPFLDRGVERRPWKRPIPVGGVAIVLMGLLWLGLRSRLDDARDPTTSAQLVQQQKDENEYFRKPFQPYRASLLSDSPVPIRVSVRAIQGKSVFDSHGCSGCHGRAGIGGGLAPALTHVAQKYQPHDVLALLREPTARMRAGGMESPRLSPDEIASLVSYLGSLGSPSDEEWAAFMTSPLTTDSADAKASLSAQPLQAVVPIVLTVAQNRRTTASTTGGAEIFQSHACAACHGEGGIGTRLAPSLIDVGTKFSADALTKLLRNPTAKMTAGGMPRLQLNASELSSLVSYLRELRPAHTGPQPNASSRTASGLAAVEQPQNSVTLPVRESEPVSFRKSALVEDAHSEATWRETTLSQSRGEGIFVSRGCSACHGAGGVGTRLAPALTGIGSTRNASDLTTLLEHPTAKMRAGGMPLVNLSRPQMDDLISYIENLDAHTGSLSANAAQLSKAFQPHDLVSSSAEPPAMSVAVKPGMTHSEQIGKSLFEARACSRCHGIEGRGGTAAAPPLAAGAARIPPEILLQMFEHPTNHMREGGMPAIPLTKEKLAALAAYVSYISGELPIRPPVNREAETRQSSLERGQGLSH